MVVIDYLVQVRFSQEDMVDAAVTRLELDMNDEVPGSEKYKRLNKIISHARSSKHTCVESDGENGFILIVDGVAIEETL